MVLPMNYCPKCGHARLNDGVCLCGCSHEDVAISDFTATLVARIKELEAAVREQAPIPMILHCPKCHTQHVDSENENWENPPHKSHQCESCGAIWRPCDRPTEGVRFIGSIGKADDIDYRDTETQ